MRPPLPPSEPQRLDALMECGVLNTPPEQAFDDLTRLAAAVCQTPIALIPLVAESHQWFKSRVGIDLTETSRDVAFCAHAILSDEPLIIEDASADPRFRDNPFVIGPPHARAYAGVPLVTREGHRLGTLCVIDTRARRFSTSQIDALKALAAQASSQLDLRQTLRRMERAELGLHRALLDANEANRAKAQFLSLMSDELRTPLNEVIGAVELLRRTAADDRQRRCAEIASNAAEALLEMVSDVLDLCRIEGDDLRLQRIPFDPRGVLNDVLDAVRRQPSAASLRIIANTGDKATGTLRGDPARLRQILANLAQAALAIADAGALELHAEALAADEKSCTIHFEIRDPSGCIPLARLERLADAFRQISTSASRHFARVGLRLAIASRLADMMGSPISVDDGPGVVFSLTLRLPVYESHARVSQATVSHRRALVAVDDPIAREILDQLLRSTGVQPLHAAPGAALGDLLARHPADLVILQTPSSRDDALARVTSLRAATRLPLLLLGPNPSPEAWRAAAESGPADRAALPLAPDEFLEKAHGLLGPALEPTATGPGAPRAA